MEGLLLKHVSHDTQHYLTQIKFDSFCCEIPPVLEMDYMIQLIHTAEKHHSFKNDHFLLIS